MGMCERERVSKNNISTFCFVKNVMKMLVAAKERLTRATARLLYEPHHGNTVWSASSPASNSTSALESYVRTRLFFILVKVV